MIGILLNDNGELQINPVTHSVMLGEIDAQNAKMIIQAAKGEFKEKPLKGVDASKFAETQNPQDLIREIKKEFFIEGLKINKLRINNSNLEIDVKYE